MPRAAPPRSTPRERASRAETPARRRTQGERSDAMRKRLIDATLKCLASEGYSGTTVSSIVRKAGVSRGAQLHHFSTKNALILAAADHLLRRAYKILGDLLLGIAQEEHRLQALVAAAWAEIFDNRSFNAFFELLIASQHDAELERSLRKLFGAAIQATQEPIRHYFEPRSDHSLSPSDLFVMTPLLMSGMAASRHLVSDPQVTRRYLETWTTLMLSQMRARKGVSTPPPRPLNWDVVSS